MKNYQAFLNNILIDVNVNSIIQDNTMILYNNINNNSFLFFESQLFFDNIDSYYSLLIMIKNYLIKRSLFGYEFEKVIDRITIEVSSVDDINLYNDLMAVSFDC